MLETLALMGHGFVNAMSLSNLLFMAGGTAIGIIIGCLPGLSAAMGVALLLPMTFTMAPETGLIVLGAIYCGAIFGGSLSAILIHTPGTPASAATAIEGYQLTLQGKAGKALAVACFSSFCGGLLSCVSLYFFAPLLAQLAMKFGSPEYFWLSIFGLTIIAGVASKSLLKGLISGALGLLLSTIGMDPMEGAQRFMFGQASLYEGINTTCALIGLFSMSQVLILAEKKIKQRAKAAKFSDKITLSGKEIKRITPTILRSWIIGNLIGIDGTLPARVNHLRIGEFALLGGIYGCYPDFLRRDVFTLRMEVVECKPKPSYPVGELTVDAFGKTREYTDRGIRRRALCAGPMPFHAGKRKTRIHCPRQTDSDFSVLVRPKGLEPPTFRTGI